MRAVSRDVTLAASPSSAPAARRVVGETCAAWGLGIEDTDVVRLLATELVTNAIRHAGSGGRVVLRMVRADRAVRVEVEDRHPGWPHLAVPRPDDEGGRGLALVNALATTWGTVPAAGGKVVWFEVADSIR
ncbi:MAG: ATP-binding protein [Mycobacteriales bacterium]